MIGAYQNTFIYAAHFLFARDWDLMYFQVIWWLQLDCTPAEKESDTE